MNTFVPLILLSIGLTFVICDDVQCFKDGNKALEGKTDQQLYELTQQNLDIGKKMALKRAATAGASGLTCYKTFYDGYMKGLTDILVTGEKARLDKAKTPEERSAATKSLASISQAVRCDEDWRAAHLDETIKSATCTAGESVTNLDLLKFKPKLALLQGGMFVGKTGLKFSNNVVSGVVGELLGVFGKIYPEGAQCARSQSSDADKCRNMKMFVIELDRLFTLVQMAASAKA